jgi:glutamine amidotransferase
MIAIVDYGIGNVRAFVNIYRRLNIPAEVVSTADTLRMADRIILPGVGAFDWGMRRLNQSGLRGVLEELVLGLGKPVLGICVGMQMLANRSEEGVLDGLGWIEGEVIKFDISRSSGTRPLPHMGWNDVEPREGNGLFDGLESKSRFYFLHSYCFLPRKEEQVLAVTEYLGSFVSAIRDGNVYGVQFHPEKSHHYGIQLLKNFAAS